MAAGGIFHPGCRRDSPHATRHGLRGPAPAVAIATSYLGHGAAWFVPKSNPLFAAIHHCHYHHQDVGYAPDRDNTTRLLIGTPRPGKLVLAGLSKQDMEFRSDALAMLFIVGQVMGKRGEAAGKQAAAIVVVVIVIVSRWAELG